MFELVRAAADHDPAAPASIHCGRVTTFGEILDRSVRAAGALQAGGVRRFGVIAMDPADVVPLLAAASALGAEACVLPAAGGAVTLQANVESFDLQVVVSTGFEPAGVTVLRPADLFAHEPAEIDELPEQRPHLVLTTGTTGHPRAARHDWNRLLVAVEGVRRTAGERWLLAYAMNQFGGLQILLHGAASGAAIVSTDPVTPAEGLAAMTEQGVTHASATPTYWRFVLNQLKSTGLPAPALRQVTLGGEPVPEVLLEQLAAAFPQARITQIYGANEYGRNLSVRDSAIGVPIGALSSQRGLELKVVDGELWVRSEVGMLGYYGEPPIDADAWRPTGDLVEVRGDRLFFRGRASEVINVGGVKVHPFPVEERVSKVPGVALSRVFGRGSSVMGSVVAVEVTLDDGFDPLEVDQAIRAACADLPPAAQPRSIRVVDEIETVQGKLRRGTEQTRVKQ